MKEWAVLFWRNRHEVRGEELSAFIDNELEESARLRVERHIESCTPCTEALGELRAVSLAISELPAVPAPRSFTLRQADVDPVQAIAPSGLFGSVQPLLGGVAAIAIVAFVVLVGVDITEDGATNFDAGGSRMTSQELETAAFLAENQSESSAAERTATSAADVLRGNEDIQGGEFDDATVDSAIGTLVPESGELPLVAAADDAIETRAPDRSVLPDVSEEPPLHDSAGQGALAADDDRDSTGLRVAESVAAAVAIGAGGSVLLLWWRRRAAVG